MGILSKKLLINSETASKNTISDEFGKHLGQVQFALVVTGFFFIIAVTGLLQHEMWRDELQAWLIARDASSITELLKNVKYEGNPALWHLLLFFVTRFTVDPVYMQILHLLIACTFIFVFNRYAEIKNIYKVMFSFGYFTLYEYCIISRSYGLGVMLIFIACALYKNRYRNYVLLGIVLAFLANVTIYGIIFSSVIAVILFLDYIFFQKNDVKKIKQLIAGAIITIFGVIISLYQIIPDNDNTFPIHYPNGFFELDRWGFVFSRVFTTYFYIPKINGLNFWNTNLYFGNDIRISGDATMFVISDYIALNYLPALVFFLTSIIFLRKPLILLLYASITLGLLFVYYFTDLMFARYCGYLLIALIVCYWLEKYYQERKYKNLDLIFLSKIGEKIRTPFLIVVLFVNIIGAAIAYSKDCNNKFSISKDAANYIHENKFDLFPIAGETFYVISPLSAYLNKKIFYFQRNEFGSFCIYDKKLKLQVPDKEIVNSLENLLNKNKTKILLILSFNGKSLNELLTKDIKIDFIKCFKAGIVSDELYYIYLVSRTDSLK